VIRTPAALDPRPRLALTLAAIALLAALAAPADGAQVIFAESHPYGLGHGSSPRFLSFSVGGAALFLTNFHPTEVYPPQCLWRTDGTEAGTAQIPGCIAIADSRFEASVGGRLFFPAFVATEGYGQNLWTSDGTVAGTRPLTDFQAGHGIFPSLAAGTDDPLRFAFLADDGVHGAEPWVSDGTPEGTRLVLDVTPGEAGTGVTGLASFAGKLFFLVDTFTGIHELWTSDFTAEGTRRLVTLPPDLQVVGHSFTGAAGIVFSARETAGCSLWGSDGTVAGTRRLAAFVNPCNGFGFRYASAAGVPFAPGSVYFLADDGVHGREVWRTDGAVAERVTDFVVDEPFDFPLWFFPAHFAGKLFVIADGGPGIGIELYTSTGDPASTELFADICPGDCSAVHSGSFPAPTEDRLFFGADDGVHGFEPWSTDGTVDGTAMRADVCPGACTSSPAFGMVSGHGFYLQTATDPTHDEELWGTDSATGVMTRLTDLAPPVPISLYHYLDVAHGVVFAAGDYVHGPELWITDGTPDGTRMLANLAADPPPITEPPAAPTNLRGTAKSLGGIADLAWDAGTGGGPAEVWAIEARSPGFDWTRIDTFGGNSTYASVVLGENDTPYTLRVRGENSAGVSAWSAPVDLTTAVSYDGYPCTTGQGLCLNGGRFLVEVDWRNHHAGPGDPVSGVGVPVPGSDLSGYFWFFKPDNVELIVKVLDGSTANGFYWTFYGALSDVEYWITVTDLATLERRTYRNPPGQICGRGDTTSFTGDGAGGGAAAEVGEVGAVEPTFAAEPSPAAEDLRSLAFDALPRTVRGAAHPFIPCVEDEETLCLLDGRFRVRVTWTDQHNDRFGVGSALPYANRSGFFTFFNPDNVELVVKVLDGTQVNGKIWVFYGALSDVGYRITVDDMADDHASREYVNPPGTICGRADGAAF